MAIEKIKKHIYVNTAYDGANVACIQTGGGRVLVTITHNIEIEGQDKPACVAETLTMFFT